MTKENTMLLKNKTKCIPVNLMLIIGITIVLSGCNSIQEIFSSWPKSTLETPQFSVRVMSYNIWFGAGVNPAHIERGSNMNRLEDLITLVRSADPDILGLQEVCEWTSGNPSTIDYFASELNMNYYLAPSWRGINTALFSKYPILETENLSEYVGNNGALRAVVQTPDGQRINVVVVHLDPVDKVLRSCQFDKLRRIMESYKGEISILLGDINTLPYNSDAKYLTKGGWELAQSESIDNIFILSGKTWSSEAICFSTKTSNQDCVLDTGISDHRPVGTTFSFYDTPSELSNKEELLTPDPIDGCKYNRAPAETPNDRFDYTGLDTEKWRDVSYGDGKVEQNNRLVLSTDGTQPSSSARIQSRWTLNDDFDIQIDFQIADNWGYPAIEHVDGAFLGVKIAGQDYHITRIRTTNDNKFFAWSTTGDLAIDHPTTSLSGKYRMVRKDAILYFYYDIGQGWEELSNISVPKESALVYIGNATVNVSQSLTTFFDNFVITSGSVKY